MLDIENNYFGEFSKFGKKPGELYWPCSLTFDSKDNVYITDEYTHTISIFSPEGDFIKRWGVRGEKEGELNFPSGITTDNNDLLYITDNLNNRIQVMTLEGDFIKTWGKEGNEPGNFDKPWGIKIINENILVADWRNDRIQIFDKDGYFLDQFGKSGRKEGELFRPSDVTQDKNGFYYVCDWGNQKIQIFEKDFNYCGFLRGEATISEWAKEYLEANIDEKKARESFVPVIPIDNLEPHEESARIESYFWDPTSIIIDNNQNLLVLDSNRNRIQIFKIN